jgi:hypothetical protein
MIQSQQEMKSTTTHYQQCMFHFLFFDDPRTEKLDSLYRCQRSPGQCPRQGSRHSIPPLWCRSALLWLVLGVRRGRHGVSLGTQSVTRNRLSKDGCVVTFYILCVCRLVQPQLVWHQYTFN